MFDILFHIKLFISLIEIENPLKTSNEKTLVALPVCFLVDIEHPLKTLNNKTHV